MDALRLDDELASLLKEQLKKAIGLIPTVRFPEEIKNCIYHTLVCLVLM